MSPVKSKIEYLTSHLKELKDDGGLNPLRQQVLQQQLLSRLVVSQQPADLPKRYMWAVHKFSYTYVAVATFLIVAMTGGTVMAAKGALPGDTLYPVKRIAEKVESTLAPTPAVKANVEASHASERLNEIIVLQQRVVEANESDSRSQLEQRELKAREQTENEVETALNVLKDLQIKFESSGKNQDASVLNKALEQLSKKASDSEFEVKYEDERGRYRVKNNRHKKSESSDSQDNQDKLKGNSSGNNSLDSENTSVDAKENSNEVFCRGEWRDPADCVSEPPVAVDDSAVPADNSSTPVNENQSSNNSDVKEDDQEVFCRGEWRDPEDCER